MMNDRPIESPALQAALNEVRDIMRKYDLAGACMLVAPLEAAFAYKLAVSWSAFMDDPTTPTGVRFRAKSAELGHEVASLRVEAGVHTVCQLADFGEQTHLWMGDLKTMLRKAGIEFDHVSFGGQPLSRLVPDDD
jgi:hypothetical protein